MKVTYNKATKQFDISIDAVVDGQGNLALPPSASGKTNVLASSGGFQRTNLTLEDGRVASLNLNLTVTPVQQGATQKIG